MSEKCLKNIDKYCMMYNVMTYTFIGKALCAPFINFCIHTIANIPEKCLKTIERYLLTYSIMSSKGTLGALCIFCILTTHYLSCTI